ncbi:Helix-turn-helix domain-containing protein [Geosporobacter subterraneus DSM 17957]|uniref:Helix-turn-helix domain-containing protein n=1 Tax=Geosporobacter subterraneus DSM 17957 TaxID=1121919 RepID=A0A1M6L614_9FIRM|nr:helix-turn-helix domain-containing protein [Geosporobacter subterraneus]SHJ66544.1 Helix-turn-helix domain-containing protein [Geosporobacter subterraneus DSM 17957]
MSNSFLFKKMENLHCDYRHPSYYLERKLLNEMKRGLEKQALQTLDTINSTERATLADNPLRSLKNSLIASCTLFTRAAVEANVHPEDVFSQSDVFIIEIERLNNIKELQAFEYHMVKTFIKMINQERVRSYSLPITRMINYIHEHITEKISLDVLARLTEKSAAYLSAEFKNEVGLTVTDYIQQQKIENSKDFLELTNMSIHEIATLFSFCNTAYYASVFKKHMGMTPSVYRSKKNI